METKKEVAIARRRPAPEIAFGYQSPTFHESLYLLWDLIYRDRHAIVHKEFMLETEDQSAMWIDVAVSQLDHMIAYGR